MSRVWLLAAALVSCSPHLTIRGSVRQGPDPCRLAGSVAQAGRPIAQARVRVLCVGEQQPRLSAESDASGRFEGRGEGAFDLGCAVLVEKPGYETRTFALADLCAASGGFERCRALSLNAELEPVPEAGEQDRAQRPQLR